MSIKRNFHYFGSFVILRHPLLVNCSSAVSKFGMDGWPMISINFAKEVDLSLGRFAKAQIACAFQVGGTDQWRKLRRCLLFLSFASLQFLCTIVKYCTILHNFALQRCNFRLYLYLRQQRGCCCCGFNKNGIKGSLQKLLSGIFR